MLGESINYLGGQMKKSIFRQIDRFELLSCYVFCFCFNTIFDYFKSLSIDSYFLYDFLKQLYDYQTLIVLLISFIVVISHYQIVSRKKVEVHCRIIVGDTIWSAVLRYFVECLILLGVAFGISVVLNVILDTSITNNFYLSYVFFIYILISSGQVKRYESI